MRRIFVFVLCGFLMSSGGAQAADDMNAVSERYAHLVLALGQHDPDYVDAFYGPPEWKTQAEKEKKSMYAIGAEAAELIATMAKTPDAATSGDGMLKLRRELAETNLRVGGAGADVEGRKIKVRRRIARALRRRSADIPP